MTEADILAQTYTDTCIVYRTFKEKLPNGETVHKKGSDGEVIYENILCALSSPSGGKLHQSESTATTPKEYCLFVRPEVRIRPNDTVFIVNELGIKTKAIAGKADYYSSHANIPLKDVEELV